MNARTLGGLLPALLGQKGMQGFRPILEQAEATVIQLGELAPAGEYAVERLDTAPPGKGVNNMVNDMPLKRKAKLLPLMLRIIDKVTKCGEYMADDFIPMRSDADETTWRAVEALARQRGAVEVGFVRIDENDIFQELAIPYRNAIVFTFEMERAAIDSAPSYDALIEVVTTYAALGTVAIALTEHLRAQGYAAYPGFPIGGLVDYVRVAEQAGIGGIGYHGLLISPTAGTRQRIDVVFTNMDVPEPKPSPHEWILDFCARCNKCVRSCPPQAIHTDGEVHPVTGRKSTVFYDKCVTYYGENQGCAVCVKVCPFSQAGYEKVMSGFMPAPQETAEHAQPPPDRKNPETLEP